MWRRLTQRGYASLAFGMVGLVMCGVVASPLVGRAATALRAQETSSPVGVGGTIGASSAAEHALWRIANDPAFLQGMSGTPPTTVYTLDLPEGTATITVVQSSTGPGGDGLNVYLTVAPALIQPDTPTTVDYTIRIVNDGETAKSIDRIEADPQSFSPTYIADSTTGLTTADPVYTAGKWRWTISPTVPVPPFGGQVFLYWQMTINQNEGDYFVGGSARFVGIGTISAPMTSSVRVADMNDIQVSTVVSPALVSSGSGLTFAYTVTVTNNATSTRTIDWLKHYTTKDFSHQIGSTTGFTTADPQKNSDGSGLRWEFTWNVSVPIAAQESTQLLFDMTADLAPGTYYAESKMRAEEDQQSNGQEATATTGSTSPILAVRTFTITAVLNGRQVDVDASLDSTGVTVRTWTEQ